MAKRKPPRADLPPWVIRLNNWMTEKDWLAADLIRELGGGKWEARVYGYLRGRGAESPSAEIFDALAKPFGRKGVELEHGQQVIVTRTRQVPLIPMNETGTLIPARKIPEMWSGNVEEVSDSSLSDQVFTTIAEDNACAPTINAGDKLIVDLEAPFKPGDFILAVVAKRDNNVVCRKFRPLSTDDETRFALISTNDDFPPFEVGGAQEGAVIGRVMEVRKKL